MTKEKQSCHTFCKENLFRHISLEETRVICSKDWSYAWIFQASNDSGKGGSVQENTSTSPPDEDRLFEFNIPSELCGLFIGTRGKTIKMISQQSGTKIRLQNNPYTRDFQICVIEGKQFLLTCAQGDVLLRVILLLWVSFYGAYCLSCCINILSC